MAQENYFEGCSLKRPPFLEPNGFCFWKARFETYVKSKDIDLCHTLIITHQGNSQVKNCNIDILTKEYEKFSIYNKELLDSGFTRFNAIVTCLKSLNSDYSSKNHVRKFLRALLLKWRAKVTTIEEAKDLATLYLDELIGNLKVYEMVLDNDSVTSKNTKEKVKSLAFNDKVTREETSNDNECQDESDEEESEAFNLLARNFRKFFHKVKKLFNKEVVEPCQKCVELTQEVDSLTSNVSKLQDEALNISKFKSSSIALDDILSRQKLSQDEEGGTSVQRP
ncbi:hypothetical protein Tco_0138401 [Tanacetum coccineum]